MRAARRLAHVFFVGGQRIQGLLHGSGVVAPPGLGNACGLLYRHALPALRQRTQESGSPVAIGCSFGAKGGGVLLAEPQIFCGQGIQRCDFGMVDIAEANRRDGTGQAHQVPSPSLSTSSARGTGVFFRRARLRPERRAVHEVLSATKSCITSSCPVAASLTITSSQPGVFRTVWREATPKRDPRSVGATALWLMLVSASTASTCARWSVTPEPH